ncbi:hypothetical protein D5086_022295 [Populus alba]|uniref:Uncharacterized protein n=1 Tax=Populus alba TaxID=43335 RepID=A0ACC4BG12_POPAL
MINRNTTRVPLTLAVAVSCRRYWTLGGNLRNVTVRGDCRRGKRSKRLSLLVPFCFEDKRIKEFLRGMEFGFSYKTHPIGPSRNYGLCFNGLMAT